MITDIITCEGRRENWQFWKVGTDIASISVNLIERVLILYVETFKADEIVFIGDVILTDNFQYQTQFLYTSNISLGEINEKMSKLSIIITL